MPQETIIDELELIIKEVYEIINNQTDLNDHRAILEAKLKKAIDLNWSDGNIFETYFSDFAEVINSMYQLDFSKRLKESDDKDSFLNMIAQSLNLVNQRLQSRYLSNSAVPSILESLQAQDRVVFVSSDYRTVSNAWTSIEEKHGQTAEIVGLRLSQLFDKSVLAHIANPDVRSIEIQKSDFTHPFFDTLETKDCLINIVKNEVVTISVTFNPEAQLLRHIPRILRFIEMLKHHFDDNPHTITSLFGNVYSIEINMLYHDLIRAIERNRLSLK